MADDVRIQKFLSGAGVASRREAERLMVQGRVKVNGEVATELGTKIDPDADEVEVDGRVVDPMPIRWIVFHKPPGLLTTRSDPHGGRTVYDALPVEAAKLRYVGRLDKDAEGLLLLTNDGDLSNRIQHPSSEIEREYWIEVAGTIDAAVPHALVAGVELEDGIARAKRAEVVEEGDVTSRLTLVLTEGRKREVRRMLAEVGHPVLRLRRLRYGPISLGALPRGEWRDLDASERRALRRAVGD